MLYQLCSYVEITKTVRPTDEQVAQTVADEFARAKGYPTGQIPNPKVLSHHLDRSEFFHRNLQVHGIVEHEGTDQEVVSEFLRLFPEFRENEDRRFFAIPLTATYKYDGKTVVAA